MKARARDRSGGARLGESVRQAWTWTRRALGAAAAVALLLGSLHVRGSVRGDERYRLDGWKIELGELPDWVTPEIRDELEEACAGGSLPGEPGDWNVLDPGVLRRLREVLEARPWISRLVSARLEYPVIDRPGMLALQLELRRPVALVDHGGLYYLADAEGRRLGQPYREPPSDWFRVPAVTGLASPGPLPQPGERWASRDVGQGIEVARLLFESGIVRDFPDPLIHAIDLTNLHGRKDARESEIVLWCGRQRLAWGRSPISAGARSASIPEVIGNLRFVLSHPETFGKYALIHLHRRQDDLTGVRG